MLRGSVVNPVQRAEVVRIARGVVGVRAVDDKLRARPRSGRLQGGRENRRGDPRCPVLDHAVPAYGIDKVTLCGAVDIASQRAAAERIALRVLGASEVRNGLKVW